MEQGKNDKTALAGAAAAGAADRSTTNGEGTVQIFSDR